MNLGENIKTARKAAGVTQKELAERLPSIPERYKPLGKQRAYAKRNNTGENLQRA